MSGHLLERLKVRSVGVLRASEKYTKTDMVYLTQGGFWLTLSQVLGILASLATSVAFANWLPEETYGIFRYVLSALPILAIPTLTGMDMAISRAVAQGKESAVYHALSLKVRWGLWGTVGALGLSAYYHFNGNVQLATLFLISAAFIPLMEPFNLFVAFLSGRKDFKKRAYLGAIPRLVPAFVLVGIVFFTTDITILILGYFISYTLSRLFALYYTLRHVPRHSERDPAVLGLGKHLSLMGILGTLSTSLDSILIFHFGGAAVLAGYYLAIVPEAQISSALANINILALPKLSTQDAAQLKKDLPHKIAKAYYLIVPIILGYVIVSPIFFSLFYPKYIAYVILSDVFMLRLLVLPLGLFSTAFTALGEKRKLYISSFTYALVRILLLLILVPLYGIWGAAIGILVATILTGFIKIYLFFR